MKNYLLSFKANGNPQSITIEAENKKDLKKKYKDYCKKHYPGYKIETQGLELEDD